MLLDISWDSFTNTDELEKLADIESIDVVLMKLGYKFRLQCSGSDNKIIQNL